MDSKFVTPRPVPQFNVINTFSTKKVNWIIPVLCKLAYILSNIFRKGHFLARKSVLLRPQRRSYRHTTVALAPKKHIPSHSSRNRTRHWYVALTTICRRKILSFVSVSKFKLTSVPDRSAMYFVFAVKKMDECTPSSDHEYLSVELPTVKRNWRKFVKWSLFPTTPIAFVFIKHGRKTNSSISSSSFANPVWVKYQNSSMSYQSPLSGTTWSTYY